MVGASDAEHHRERVPRAASGKQVGPQVPADDTLRLTFSTIWSGYWPKLAKSIESAGRLSDRNALEWLI